MADMAVATAAGWRRLLPLSRVTPHPLHPHIFTPDAAELMAILALFGRPKDLVRRDALARHIAARPQN